MSDNYILPAFSHCIYDAEHARLFFRGIEGTCIVPTPVLPVLSRATGVVLPLHVWSTMLPGHVVATLKERNYLRALPEFSRCCETALKLPCSVAICTRNRPDHLSTCLRGLARWLSIANCRTIVSVLDSSDDPFIVRKNSESATGLAKATGLCIRHLVASAEVERLSKVSAAKDVTEAIRYCVDVTRPEVITTGASRNIALLASVGSHLLFLDDDVDLSSVYVRGKCDLTRLRLSGNDRPAVTRCSYGSDILAGLDMVSESHSLIDHVLSHLQPTLDPLVGQYGRLEIDRLDGPAILYLLSGRLRASTVMCGHVGDTGFGSMRAFMMPSSNVQSDTSDTGLRTYHPRNVIVGASECLLTSHPFFMTMCAAIDNRSLTPPFMPLGRGQDTLFMKLMRMSDPSTLTGHLPYLVSHRLNENDRANHDLPGFSLRLNMIIGMIAQQLMIGVGHERTALDGLRLIAHGISGIANLSDCALDEWLSEIWHQEADRALQWLNSPDSQLEVTPVGTEERRRVLRDYQDLWATHKVLDRLVDAPADWSGDNVGGFKNELRRFADLLFAWPEVRDAATRAYCGFSG